MSVNYESALIYGYKCNPADWDWADLEHMEDKGWDVIRDNYSDEFLYIGRIISHSVLGEEKQVDILQKVIENMSLDLIDDIPLHLFCRMSEAQYSLYHICYAT